MNYGMLFSVLMVLLRWLVDAFLFYVLCSKS